MVLPHHLEPHRTRLCHKNRQEMEKRHKGPFGGDHRLPTEPFRARVAMSKTALFRVFSEGLFRDHDLFDLGRHQKVHIARVEQGDLVAKDVDR